jgi:hypothetical protein
MPQGGEVGMYGDFMLFDAAGKLEKGERLYLGDVHGKNEGWLRDTLFENPEIIPIKDIDSTFFAKNFVLKSDRSMLYSSTSVGG